MRAVSSVEENQIDAEEVEDVAVARLLRPSPATGVAGIGRGKPATVAAIWGREEERSEEGAGQGRGCEQC